MLDKESRAQLESLGYISNILMEVEESYEFDQTDKDPKDVAIIHSLYSQLTIAFENGQYNTVKLLCDKLFEEDPTFKAPYYYAGTIAIQEKNYEKAAEYPPTARWVSSRARRR